MKQEDLTQVSKDVYTSTIVVSYDPLSTISTTSSVMKTTENKQDDPEPAKERKKPNGIIL